MPLCTFVYVEGWLELLVEGPDAKRLKAARVPIDEDGTFFYFHPGLQGIREIQAPDLRNRTIAVSLQQFHYLTTKGVVIEQKAADIR